MILSGKKYLKDIVFSCAVMFVLLLTAHKAWIFYHNESSATVKPELLTHDKEKLLLRSSSTPDSTNNRIDAKRKPAMAVNQSNPQRIGPVKVIDSNMFMNHTATRSKSLDFRSFLGSSSICPASYAERYKSSSSSSSSAQDLKWCQDTRDTYNVVIGLSWGGLLGPKRKEWDTRGCNDLLKLGKLQTCDERYGWKFCTDWMKNLQTIVSGTSEVKCATNLKATVYCRSKDVVIDFSKAKPSGLSRSFSRGFLQTYGTRTKGKGGLPEVPGLQHIDDANADMHCDEVEERPTFVLSNDDIGNLGHYINDVMMIWNMVVLANCNFHDSVLLNIDGIRAGGPAGGAAHRLMDPSDPDKHGPYADYFRSWFQELRRGVDYDKRRVCFKEIYFQPLPGVPWFWNDWGIVNQCSMESSSPLYQSFNLMLRHKWLSLHGPQSLPMPDQDRVHIVIEVRKINPAKTNNHSSVSFSLRHA
jgi:hypothetical protein